MSDVCPSRVSRDVRLLSIAASVWAGLTAACVAQKLCGSEAVWLRS